MRKIERTYNDPLDLIWLHAAKELGINIVRDAEVFAAWDGQGELKIGVPETLDEDDCLAQMIFHELCHALIEGPEKFTTPDWGLEMDNPNDVVHEHAALRLQARLADRYQLRKFLASTTDFRSYFDSLDSDPFSGDNDPAIELAKSAWSRATTGQWGQAIDTALQKTQLIFQVVCDIAPANSLWRQSEPTLERNPDPNALNSA